jgi:hypothetical protein
MSKSRNGTTETIESTEESMDKATESAVDTVLEVSAIVDETLTGGSSEAPVADIIGDVIEAEDARPSRRRRIARGGTIVLVTAAAALAAGVALAMVLRRRDSGDDAEADLFA